jgi:uncharacterized protein YkwD
MFSKTVLITFLIGTSATMQAAVGATTENKDTNDKGGEVNIISAAETTNNSTSILFAEEVVLSMDANDKKNGTGMQDWASCVRADTDNDHSLHTYLCYNSGDEQKLQADVKDPKDIVEITNDKSIEGSEDSEILFDSIPFDINSKEFSIQEVFFLQVSSLKQRSANLINRERRNRGLTQLCWNSKLNYAAQAHSNDMAARNFFSHRGSNGSSFVQRVQRAGYRFTSVAENIATNTNIVNAHNGLMNSPGHRRNILNPVYRHVGIGIARYNRGIFRGNYVITQVFGASNSERCS